MQVKKFTGNAIPQVMAQIRKEFGEEAIILQTNKVKKGGILGLFSKEQVEILAATDINPRQATTPVKAGGYPNVAKTTKTSNESNSSKSDFKTHLNKLNEASRVKRDDVPVVLEKEQNPSSSYIDNQQKEKGEQRQSKVISDLDEMKSTLDKLSKKINDTFKTEEEEEKEEQRKQNISKLVNLGVSEVFSSKIIDSLSEKDKSVNFENVTSEIKSQLSMVDFYEKESFNKNVIFVGSTGVGKTTTLAKVASKYMIENNNKIGFLTLDTYRISAVEQLKNYADILSSPIEVAYEIGDIKTAMDRLSNRDRIYIDTAGRSHHNKKQIAELKQIIDSIEGDKKIYLVISANINLNDIIDIIKVYEFLPEYDIIITKLDETLKSGSILDIINLTQKNISYVTFGQNVPDDMERFNIDMYLSELLKETFK